MSGRRCDGTGPVEFLPSNSAGYALVEALVAAALLGWILLVGLEFLTLQRRTEEYLLAHRQAMRAIEFALESVRANAIPLEPGTIELDQDTGGFEVTLALEITQEPAFSDLYRVEVEARYQVRKKILNRRVETLVWRP